MAEPRVKRSKGPQSVLTKNTCRKKALPHLQKDFENRCAYCLQHMAEQHTNQSHVEHFNPHLPGRRKHQYKNLMLGCSACNLSKLFKPIRDPLAPERRMLNCTKENEFPEHILENDVGEWQGRTEAGDYHITSMDLNEASHIRRRLRRRAALERVSSIQASAITYTGSVERTALKELEKTLAFLHEFLETSVPLVTETGLVYPRLLKNPFP